MDKALPESKIIFDQIFDDEQKDTILLFLEQLRSADEKSNTEIIWNMDQKIGGVGGYCMPADPKYNLFPGGVDRELFRPLQYARLEFDNWNLWTHARYVVHYSGMHLEAAMRLFLQRKTTLGNLRHYNTTLGKAAHKISKMSVVDDNIIDVLFQFIKIYNKAKHEVNMMEERERLFAPSDAVVGYFCARIIGQVILEELEYPVSQSVYKINNEPINRLM